MVSRVLLSSGFSQQITMKEFYSITKIEFTATATDITNMKAHNFNYKTRPDMTIVQAVSVSMSYPLAFKPTELPTNYSSSCKIEGSCNKNIKNSLFADGGVLNNFPLDSFDYIDKNGNQLAHRTHNNHTLGLKLISSSMEKLNHKQDKINTGTKNFLKKMVYGLHQEANRIQQVFDQDVRNNYKRIIEIDVGNVSTFDFNASKDVKNWLVLKGFQATLNFFSNDQFQPE